jgi:type III secretory pathway component EscS
MYAESTDEVIARAYTDIWQLLLSDTVVVAAAVAGVLVIRAVTAAQAVRAYGATRRDTVPAA